MAKLTGKKVVLKVRLNNGQNDNGKTRFKNVTFKDVNPAISEDKIDELGNKLVGLQSLPLVEVYKVQTEKVEEA